MVCADGRRLSGGAAAFRRVDAEVWGKEVIAGLEDNSCIKLSCCSL